MRPVLLNGCPAHTFESSRAGAQHLHSRCSNEKTRKSEFFSGAPGRIRTSGVVKTMDLQSIAIDRSATDALADCSKLFCEKQSRAPLVPGSQTQSPHLVKLS